MRLTDITRVLIFAFIAHQFVQVKSLRDRGRKEQPDGKRRGRGDGGLKGRFSRRDGARCSWLATRAGDAFVLGVTCKHGTETFGCEYVAKPTACPQFTSDSKTYWKQIARALKKQKSLCRDSTAIVRAGMCRSTHFRLKDAPASGVLLPGKPRCPDRVERLRVAEEFCSSSWSSVCTFLFLMLESDECS